MNTTHKRHAAIGALLAGLTLTGLVAADRNAKGQRPAVSDVSSTRAVGGPRPQVHDGRDRIPNPVDRPQIEATVRAFLAAYVPYTHGKTRLLRNLRSGVIANELRARLSTEVPHTTGGPVDYRVSRILVERLGADRATAVAEVMEPSGHYAVALILTRTSGGWQIIDLRPGG